jgi:hypothetical protein
MLVFVPFLKVVLVDSAAFLLQNRHQLV